MPEILLDAFKLKPEAASEFFRAKGHEFSWDWFDTWQEAHSKSFTVAKAMKMDILTDIRGMVQEAMDKGITLDEFRRRLEPTLKAKGWWGRQVIDGETAQLGSPWRLKNIYQTNLQTAYMAGREKGMEEVRDRRPFWMYIAVLDAKTRPTHRALHGKVFKWNDPFWDKFYPPLDWGCRCRVKSLSQREMDRDGVKADYSTGKIKTEEALVSKKTGEMRDISVFHDIDGTGLKIKTGPGWDYNPGRAQWAPNLKQYKPELQKAYKAERYGLLAGRKIKDINDVHSVIADFHNETPGVFERGFKGVEKIKKERGFMSTDGRGTIFINDKTFRHLDNFNPHKDSVNAFQKIAKGEELTFNEEYAVESIWHETTHNRVKNFVMARDKNIRAVNEVVTQFISRRTYGSFMKTLGAEPKFFNEIMEKGYGYGRYVSNFRKALTALNIEEQEVFADIFNLYRESPEVRLYTQLARILAEKSPVLSKMGIAARDKAEKILDQAVNSNLLDFEGWLTREMERWI